MNPRPRLIRFGSLECVVVDGGPEPSVPVVLCHGYGAPGNDLAGLAFEWIERLGSAAGTFRFVFPAGPISLADVGMPGGRAWWPINMARLAELMNAEDFSELHDQQPPGLEEARDRLTECVRSVLDELGGDTASLVLGGFSQGAMVTMEVSLFGLTTVPAELFQFSGTLISRSRWAESASRLASCPVYQSHGRWDSILPFSGAELLRDLLQERGVSVEFHPFDGPHTIDLEAVEQTAARLRRMSAGV